jgi:hypothetical protein
MEWSAERRQLVAVLDSYDWLPDCGGHRCSSDELLHYSQGLRRSLERRRWAGEAKRTYGGAVSSLIKYCTEVQLAAGLPTLSYVPASKATLIGWITLLFKEDSVHHSSLSAYCSVVNQFHADNGFPRPCLDPEVQLACRGFRILEIERMKTLPEAQRRKRIRSRAVLVLPSSADSKSGGRAFLRRGHCSRGREAARGRLLAEAALFSADGKSSEVHTGTLSRV